VPRAALTLLMLKFVTNGDDTGFTDPWMLALFVQLGVLSIISAAMGGRPSSRQPVSNRRPTTPTTPS
jgi:hypothetical protein